ncbi:hypothetical protein MTR67_003798 [Solanum verrucosum]|uniref:TF-B3 domain-containing protein n=1 Tax=Solanum verrucosum TaxID=315347 RepID=A0AAF0PT74_SOLVR|nr:hypothetical protein MTR67_003798 [Solanum verrucosum]
MTEEAAEKALLKGPCGNNWNLKLREDENGTFFQGSCWKKFQKKQHFKGGEFLLFHYDRRITFHVCSFD